ncbi:MAG TPA: ABC transporter ATP-binding protein [Xanthobacteraceae bacterium]|nr:ABC transporter ATP-binding protein [Xanthobacteraceae bacterium]
MLKSLIAKAFADPYGAPSLIRRLLAEHGLGNWRVYALVLAMMGVSAACMAGSAYLIGHGINEAYVERNLAAVVGVSVGIVLLSTLRGLSTYGQTVELARIGNRIVAAYQKRMFEKVLRQNMAFFSDRHSSEFSARITWGARSASDTLNTLITSFGRDAFALIGLLGVMISQNPKLMLLTLFVAPPAIFIGRRAVKRVREIVHGEFSAATNILEVLQETVQGFKIVEAFNLQRLMRERVDANVDQIERLSNKLARASNLASPLMESLGGISVALVILLGGYEILVFNAAPGEFISFITAFLLTYEPAKRLARLNMDLNGSLMGVRVLFEFLDMPDRAQDDDKPALVVARGRLEFRDVDFCYQPDRLVLRGISFAAEPGCLTALVGPSGGGKSTILNLVLRFYEPYGGSILVDGTEISSVARQSLRDQLAYVGQDAFLFRGTVAENIALGLPGASQAEVVAAAKAAHADEFITQLPQGYHSGVGEHGMKLSGGQRQRISVARALIRNASIILLDEPTSFLDSESEQYVNLAISRLFGGRTRLVIAHRLHTIVNADRIYVIEDGRVVESGRHQSLLANGARYAHFFNLQFAGEIDRQAV